MTEHSIAVIIPYYQSGPGLLQRALESILAQEYQPAQVIIVDDGSPHPVQREFTDELKKRLPCPTIVRQENQGVSAARNAALSNLLPDIDAIAFLDSDDQWMPRHLRNAAEALSQGADFYFSNFVREGEAEDAFATDEGRRHLVSNSPGLVRWSRGIASLMRSSAPFTTSSVVFRRALKPDIRFPKRFRRAGEDHIVFWDLCLRATCIMYSPEVNVVYGNQGVGLWRNATLGTREHLSRLADEIRLRRYVIRHYPVQGEDRGRIRRAIESRRSQALYSALHLLHHRHFVLKEIAYLFWADPLSVPYWCVQAPRKIIGWAQAPRA